MSYFGNNSCKKNSYCRQSFFVLGVFNFIFVVFFLLFFINFSYANTENDNNKLENRQVATEVFLKYQSIAKSINITNFRDEDKDDSKMVVTGSLNLYKVRYQPTANLDILIDYNKKDKQVTSIALKSRAVDNNDKIDIYKNNFYILAKMVDPKASLSTIENTYNNIDITKVSTEPKYLKSYLSNGFVYEIDSYSKITQIFILKIRKSNKNDSENIKLAENINSLYSKTISKINTTIDHRSKIVYPEISLFGIRSKKLSFFISSNVSIELFTDIKLAPIFGSIAYENSISLPNKKEDLYEGALILFLLTNKDMSQQDASDIIEKINLDRALADKNYFKEIATKNKVYAISYDERNKLSISVKIRDAEYDKKSKISSLTRQLYNTAISDFNLTEKVKLLDQKSLSVSLLASQNLASFNPNKFMILRMYFDNSNTVLRISVVINKELLDENNLEVQKNIAIIAAKILNPDITYNEAENNYNNLKNAYGVTETIFIGNLRYKRCTYQDETLIFSKYNQEDVPTERQNYTSNVSSYNPNLIYQPEEVIDTTTGKKVLPKPSPLCY